MRKERPTPKPRIPRAAQARAYLESLAGTRLDPSIVPVFLELIDRE